MSKVNNGEDFNLLYEAYANPQKYEQLVIEKDYDDEDGKVRGEQDTGPDENELDSLKGKPKHEQVKEAVKLIKTKRYQVQDVMEATDSNYKNDILRELRKTDPVEEACGAKHDEKDEDEDEETVEEGFFDRAKATAGAMKGAAKDVASNVSTAAKNVGKTFSGANKSGFEKGKDVKSNYADRKTQRIIEAHAKKLKNALSDFATDLVKMNITDEQKAERLAENAYQSFLSEPELMKFTKARSIKK